MKTKIFTFMLFVASYVSFSQTEEFECANLDSTTNYLPQGIFSNSTDPDFLYSMEPIVLNVFFWQVNDQNGNFGSSGTQDDVTEEEVLSAVATLNIFYNKYNIFFKYRGLGQFNSPETVYVEELSGYPQVCTQVINNEGNPIVDETGFTELENICNMQQLLTYANNEGYRPIKYINIYVPYDSFASGGGYITHT